MGQRYPLSLIASEILNLLSVNGDTMKDKDLFEVLKKKYDLTYSEFLRYLMVLEVRGFITVSMPKEDVRVISLVRHRKG
ncbi:MAG: hypothetical protein LM560_07820 [Desulfurococcaceae archaeon]|nr:hypothetical protein [Desulfurococcaceae archaeon]